MEDTFGTGSTFRSGGTWTFQSNQTEFNRLLSCLVEVNQVWAENAAILMLSFAKLHFELGAAAANLTLQATVLGLFVHQMAGSDPVTNQPQG